MTQQSSEAVHGAASAARIGTGLRWLTAPLAAPHPMLWAGTAAVALVDGLWLAAAGIALDPASFGGLAALVVLLLFGAVFWSRPTSHPALRGMTLASAALMAVTASLGVLHYLAATLGRPLADPLLMRAEAALGFDWRAHVALVEAHPAVARALALAYHSSGPQIALVVIVLAATRRIGRLWAFVRLFSAALACAVAVSAFLPALGPYLAYGVQPADPDRLETVGALWHLDPLTRLRDGTLGTMDLGSMRGLVTFPSFHVSLALITAWALAPIPILGPVIIGVNGLVILATLSAGGHYLSDVLAGAALAGVLLACHALVRRPAPWDPSAASPVPASLAVRSALTPPPSLHKERT
ncbi:phosphatase PAP2 family protein [Methylobacterium oryzisoli]|uniref:phosphatase PAP2 family protein n=1 Tax=Methylobacterium oryzisoli TaxID=3385502 RepID=UPI0038927C2A